LAVESAFLMVATKDYWRADDLVALLDSTEAAKKAE
jgi:hypothetical protein